MFWVMIVHKMEVVGVRCQDIDSRLVIPVAVAILCELVSPVDTQ